MKKFSLNLIAIFTILLLMCACKNKQPTPPQPHGDRLPTQPLQSAIFNAGGCLEGNEIRANGKIILEDGKPPAGYEVHYLSSSNATPIVIAKDLAFNPDGSFQFKGKLPEGTPLNLNETGGNIFIVFGRGRASIYSGNCEGRDSIEDFDHSVFGENNDTTVRKDIDIICDEKGNMKWGDSPIKDVNDFKKQMTAELQRRKKLGIEFPALSFSYCSNINMDEMYKIFYDIGEEVKGKKVEKPAKPKGKTKNKQSKSKQAAPLQITQYESGTLKLKGKTVTLTNLRKELQAALLTYKVIPNKVPRVSVGTVGMGTRQEVETIIDESIAGAKWVRKKAALEAKNTATAKQATSQFPKYTKETVLFAKGKNSTTLTRTIPSLGSLDFNINAKKGQKMDFTIGYDFKDKDVEGFLTEPGLQDIALSTGPKSNNEFAVKRTGNHRLNVNNTTTKKITITLYLTVE